MAASSLPDELVVAILSHLDVFAIAKAELCCRQWHRASRHSHGLWRDASVMATTDAKLMAKRLESLCQRSGNRLDRIHLPLDLLGAQATTGQRNERVWYLGSILRKFPSLGVKDLFIDITTPPRFVVENELELGLEQCNYLFNGVRTALEQCGNLTHLSIYQRMDNMDLQLNKLSVDTPLASCALQSLSIVTNDFELEEDDDPIPMIPQPILLGMLRSVTRLTLQVGYKQLSLVLEAASETLEDADLLVQLPMGEPDKAATANCAPLRLLKLKSLKITMLPAFELSNAAAIVAALFRRRPICPALERCTLHAGGQEPHLLRTLFSDGGAEAPHTICIGQRRSEDHHGFVHSDGLGTLVYERFAASLSRIVFYGHNAQQFVKELMAIPSFARSEITLYVSSVDERFLPERLRPQGPHHDLVYVVHASGIADGDWRPYYLDSKREEHMDRWRRLGSEAEAVLGNAHKPTPIRFDFDVTTVHSAWL